jgi:N-acetylglucosaminyldiphosphoundecaprenol N-acetyl-beta-D-mannosaminyltransferase
LKESFKKTLILGVRIDMISVDDLIQYLILIVREQRKAILTYVNVYAINIAYKPGWFKDFINHSQVVFCDGYGAKWAARFLNGVNLQRFTPPDWFDRLAGKCTEEGISLFFLGTKKEVVEKAAAVINNKYPLLKIVGAQDGYFNKEAMGSENLEVVSRINLSRPDVLMVGFGMPAQEKWILENWEHLQVKVVIPVGAMFDYLAGEVIRAPHWMTDNGLEWLGRLIIEPGRLWRRYILGNPLFLWRIFIHHILGFSLPK